MYPNINPMKYAVGVIFLVWLVLVLPSGTKDRRFKTGYRDNDAGPSVWFKLKWTLILWAAMAVLAYFSKS